MMFCLYFFFALAVSPLHASYYVTHNEKGVDLKDEDSQNINARSPIECILKCQNKLDKKGFYTEEDLCFCTNGTFTEVNGGLEGNVYSKVGESIFSRHFVAYRTNI